MLLAILALAAVALQVRAPERTAGPPNVELIPAGNPSSIDLRRLPQVGASPLEGRKDEEEEREPPEIDYPPGELAPVGAGTANGPLAPAPSPLTTFEGMHFTELCGAVQCGDGHPPDTVGDVGPNHYVQAINTAVAVYNKTTGSRLAAFTFNDLMSQGSFGNLCDTDNFGDPVVLYDTFHDRWVLTDFAFQLDGSGNVVNPPGAYQCFAVSMSGDPVSGGWNFYSLHLTDGLQDYGKFGIWPDGLYMSANMFDFAASGSFQNVRVWALNLAQMEAGAPNVQVVSFNVPNISGGGPPCPPFTLLPSNARLQTGTPPAGRPNLFASVWCFLNTVEVWKFHVDWVNTGNSTFTGPTSSITGSSWSVPPNTVPSKSGNNLDTLGIRLMMQNQYLNLAGTESLWNAHTVAGSSSSQAAVRWYQVPVTGGTVGNATQASTWNPSLASRFMPSLAVDRLGDMAVGYSVSSSTVFPAIRYAGRLAGDATNTLPQTETSLIEGTGSQTGNCGPSACLRWGDYSAMTVDPDGCTFWYTNEYYTASGLDHHTRIGSFRFGACTPLPPPTPSPSPTASPTSSVTASPTSSASPTASPTATPTASPTASPTPTATPTATPTPTPTPTVQPPDTTPPTVSAPVSTIPLNAQLQTTNVPIRVTWSATDASGISSYGLQQSKNGGAWTTVTLPTPTTTSITLFRPPGATYRFRARATDTKANTSGYVAGATSKLIARQENDASIVYTTGWTQASSVNAYGGAQKYATSSSARATLSFIGRSVAWVAPYGTTKGTADVWIDGVFAQTINLNAAVGQPRMTVFTRSWATSSTHTIQIRVKGTSPPRVDLDAIVFLK